MSGGETWITHYFSYTTLQSEKGEIIVNKQVLIYFSISKYKDEMLYDIVPMEATHILLGRPWQYDRKNVLDGLTNKISFQFQGHKIIFKTSISKRGK